MRMTLEPAELNVTPATLEALGLSSLRWEAAIVRTNGTSALTGRRSACRLTDPTDVSIYAAR